MVSVYSLWIDGSLPSPTATGENKQNVMDDRDLVLHKNEVEMCLSRGQEHSNLA